MAKNHLKNLAEQIVSKGYASAPFHNGKTPDQASEAAKSQGLQAEASEENSEIQLRAYQIHLEKGGSDLDNWLEAEQSLRSGL